MRTILFLLFFTSFLSAQDKNLDGKFRNLNQTIIPNLLNGNSCNCDVLQRPKALDGFFQTWTSSSSNDTFSLYKGNIPAGIINQNRTPYSFKLEKNYPNPFNPDIKIQYTIPSEGLVKLVIYDVNGKAVIKRVNNLEAQGAHVAEFDGSNLAIGIYFYQLQFGENVLTKKMILIK